MGIVPCLPPQLARLSLLRCRPAPQAPAPDPANRAFSRSATLASSTMLAPQQPQQPQQPPQPPQRLPQPAQWPPDLQSDSLVSSPSLTAAPPSQAVLSGCMVESTRASYGAAPRLTQRAPM